MDRKFSITLTFACHRVADVLPEEGALLKDRMKETANRVLADLIILAEKNPVTLEQKRAIAPRVLQEASALFGYFRQAREGGWIDPDNFLVLEREYGKATEEMAGFLRQELHAPAENLVESGQGHSPRNPTLESIQSRVSLNPRQEKIVGLLKTKKRLQVWEAQKFMPEVTKRTLRRDFDDLLKRGLIERAGQWNTVSYQLKSYATGNTDGERVWINLGQVGHGR